MSSKNPISSPVKHLYEGEQPGEEHWMKPELGGGSEHYSFRFRFHHHLSVSIGVCEFQVLGSNKCCNLYLKVNEEIQKEF